MAYLYGELKVRGLVRSRNGVFKPALTVPKILCVLLSGFLVACSTAPVVKMSPEALDIAWQEHSSRLTSRMNSWRLQGRVAVRHARDSWSASLLWREEAELSREVRVVAPLGQGTAVVKHDANGPAELRLSNGEVYVGENASELLHQQLGWYLPVASLAYWIKGLPDPEHTFSFSLDNQGRLSHLMQAGWQVEYKKYRYSDQFDVVLPAKLSLTRSDWKVKLVVQNWQGVEKRKL